MRELNSWDTSSQTWPPQYEPGAHDALIKVCLERFRELTSKSAMEEHPCCACGEDQPDTEMFAPDNFSGLQDFRQRQENSDSAQNTGNPPPVQDQSTAPNPRLEYLTPSAFLKQRVPDLEDSLRYHHPVTNDPLPEFDGIILDPDGLVMQEGELFLRVCRGCCRSLKDSLLPARSIANDN